MGIRSTNPCWVVVGAVTALFVCNGPVLAFTSGVFLKPIMAETGWQRGTVSLAFAIGGVCSALTVPIIGRMMDHWSIRQVALPGIVLYAALLGLLGLSPASFLSSRCCSPSPRVPGRSRPRSATPRRSPPGSIGGYVCDLAGSYNPALIGAAVALVVG